MGTYQTEREDDTELVFDDEVEFPKNYRVLLHNDDFTTMEFVIFILQNIFGKNIDEATQIMLNVHTTGLGECGIYTYEIAQTKQQKVTRIAKENGHPLKCTIEEA